MSTIRMPERVRFVCTCRAAIEITGRTAASIGDDLTAKGWTLDPNALRWRRPAKCPRHANPTSGDRLE